ncbi:immunoglobulin superfamily DCC subclass member 3-like [Pan paniscus]|uniref:immunoglobulin superfamily DCC subclass member 3-like n=1 Tax=Pan paniscus TaxID=9597 RepID=UPI002436A324|nr:immunoglobulin superfamily DCC subclass member 3-like [Pan paniscus]
MLLCSSEPSGPELQEAVSKGTSEHVFSNLEPATAYTIHLRAYSAEGASQDSAPIFASTMGSTPAALGFSTKVLNATSVQASWELPPQLGPIQGFKRSPQAACCPFSGASAPGQQCQLLPLHRPG